MPSETREQKAKWAGFAVAALGLGIVLGSLRALALCGMADDPWQVALCTTLMMLPGTGVGLLILAFGVVVLWQEGIHLRQLQWIDWGLLILVSAIVASLLLFFGSLPSTRDKSSEVTVPIPVSKLAGSAEPLTVGQVAEIVAVVPNASKTPVPRTYTHVQVLKLVGEAGENGTLLVAVPAGKAQQLQEDLLDEGAHFTYRLLHDDPTATPLPTSTPKPGKTVALPEGNMSFDLPVAKIRSEWQNLVPGDVLLVILVAQQQDSEGKILGHEGHRYTDIKVLGVLDADGTPMAPPYKTQDANEVRIGLARGTDDSNAQAFAGQLEDAGAIHLIRLTPTPEPE